MTKKEKDINIEWEDVAEKIEEEEFKKEKKAEYDAQQSEKQDEQDDEQSDEQDEQSDEYKPIGLSSLVSGIWNEVAVEKGYDAVSKEQDAFLLEHTKGFEQKYLKDRMNILPELDAALSHIVVYLPKWLKHKKENKSKK